MHSGINLQVVVGEDYAVYIEWLDIYGIPVASTPGSKALLQVRDMLDNSLVVEFGPDNDVETEATATVLGTSGVIRLTCPREVTTTLVPGIYIYDLVVEHMDEDRTIWETGQRSYPLSGKFIVIQRVTNAEPITGGGSLVMAE